MSGADRGFMQRAAAVLCLLLLAAGAAQAQPDDDNPQALPGAAATLDASEPTAAQEEAGDRGPPEPLTAERLDEVIRSAVDWLVEHQFEDGGFGSHHSARPIEVLCSVPGSHQAFRVATSALCVMALQDSPYQTDACRRAASRGIDYLLAAHNVKRVSGLEYYSVWAFGYALQCFGEWLPAHPDDPRAGAILKACDLLAKKLDRYQSLDGGWGYLSVDELQTYQPAATSMSFTTATILVGIDRARAAGTSFPEKLVRRAVDSVARCETPEGSFCYGELWRRSPLFGVNRIKGSACRTPACQYALMLFGKEYSESARRKALEDLLVKDIRFPQIGVRRPIPHEAWYAVSGYFYLYGMAYSAYLLEGLSESDRAHFAEPLFQAVLYCREPDGSFWDYPLYNYHKFYGTAYALIALSRIHPPR